MERRTRRSVGSVRFGRVLLQRVGGMEPLSLSPLLRYQFHFFVPPSLFPPPPPLSLLLGAARKKERERGGTDPCCDSEGVSLLTSSSSPCQVFYSAKEKEKNMKSHHVVNWKAKCRYFPHSCMSAVHYTIFRASEDEISLPSR